MIFRVIVKNNVGERVKGRLFTKYGLGGGVTVSVTKVLQSHCLLTLGRNREGPEVEVV